MKYDLEKIDKKVQKKIDDKRYIHTKGVEFTSGALAMKYGYEAGMRGEEHALFVEKARVAGLLHDNAKCLSEDELLSECKNNKLPVSASEKKSPYLLHGRVGAFYAKTKYDIEDPDILNAIDNHTTGRPEMSLLEKIVFIADYIEPGRTKQPNLDEVRYLAFKNIDECVYKISDDTLNFLANKGKLIDENTVKTRDYYKDLLNNE